ncbi:MAG: nucleotidyltransferase family protein [Oscillospiraceae bacterium]
MTVCGIVAEYNPFHNGHLYLLDAARTNGASHIVAVMSGCFVQRAEPALADKFLRARTAALAGVDVVIELPVQFACASGERFASGAVELLEALGVVDMIAFGSGCGDIALLSGAAEAAGDARTLARTKGLAENGICYPAARELAVREIWGEEFGDTLADSDNILAVEYLKALRSVDSHIAPFTVARAGGVAHDSEMISSRFASASFIRHAVRQGAEFAQYVPQSTFEELQKALRRGELSDGWAALERILLFKLRSMSAQNIAALPDAAGGLGERICRAAADASSAEELFETAKTRRYTMSRVRRVALCALLGVGERDFFAPPYARVLAIGERGEELLAAVSKRARLPLSHSFKTLSEMGENCKRTAELEAHASDIYALTERKIGAKGLDFTQKLFKMV